MYIFMLFCFIVKITGLPMASKRLAKETGCKSPACHRKPCGKNNPRSPCCEPCGAVHPCWLQYNHMLVHFLDTPLLQFT